MKSVKNHLSLVIALVSILLSIQVFVIADRSISSYKETLSANYAIVIVSQKKILNDEILAINKLLSSVSELSPDNVVARLNTGMSAKNIELLKLTLPKFYKLKLTHYPSPAEIQKLKRNLLSNKSIIKVESFARNHDTIYKLLLLFKNVISVFSISVFIVTILLILKELRIWQFKHSERMNIMGLFGAPIWLRSAVLFRLAVVDALIASAFAFLFFTYMSSSKWVLEQFSSIGIDIVVFDPITDFLVLLGIAIFLSVVLASMIVLGHKEEV